MTMRSKRGFTLTLLLALAGCSEPGAQDGALAAGQPLTERAAEIDTRSCQGTRCDEPVEAQPVSATATTCKPGKPKKLSVMRSAESLDACAAFSDAFGGPGECVSSGYDGESMDFAPDGSLWFAPALSTLERDGQLHGVGVGHFSTQLGDPISQLLLDSERTNIGEVSDYSAHIAVDARAHAFVITQKRVLRETQEQPTVETFLVEFDAKGAEVGQRLSFSAPRNLWNYGGAGSLRPAGRDRLLIAPSASQFEAALVMLDTSQQQALWVRPLPALATVAVAAHPDGSVSMTSFENSVEQPDDERPTTLQHLAPDGRVTWARALPAPWNKASFFPTVGSDAAGNLILVGTDQFDLQAGEYYVHKFNAQGQSQWLLRIPTGGQGLPGGMGGAPVVDDDGNVWLVGENYSDEVDMPDMPTFGTVVYRIAADGTSCDSYRVDGFYPSALYLRAGKLHYFDGGFGVLEQ